MYQLDPDYVHVLCLKYYEGLTINKIREILEIPEGTVKSRLKKIKDTLSIGIFATAALLNPMQARAFGERVVTTIKSIVSGSLVNESIGFSPKDEQLPDQPGDVQNNTPGTINEIVNKASFDVQVPGYLPPDYELEDAQVSTITSKLSKATLKYSNGTDILIITERNAPDDYGQSIMYDNEDMLREKITIESQDYIVLSLWLL
ncbi:MAG: hypothetical protein FH756_04185 [Firmicutes bacterium]|nr:hypothetical protein [Bacillota bacterium]